MCLLLVSKPSIVNKSSLVLVNTTKSCSILSVNMRAFQCFCVCHICVKNIILMSKTYTSMFHLSHITINLVINHHQFMLFMNMHTSCDPFRQVETPSSNYARRDISMIYHSLNFFFYQTGPLMRIWVITEGSNEGNFNYPKHTPTMPSPNVI